MLRQSAMVAVVMPDLHERLHAEAECQGGSGDASDDGSARPGVRAAPLRHQAGRQQPVLRQLTHLTGQAVQALHHCQAQHHNLARQSRPNDKRQ